jgi:hypothetical protein
MRPSLLPIDLLPNVLRVHSLSEREIILPWPEVQRAVMILTASNVAVTGWEAWVKYPDGRFGRAIDDSALEMEPATISHRRDVASVRRPLPTRRPAHDRGGERALGPGAGPRRRRGVL